MVQSYCYVMNACVDEKQPPPINKQKFFYVMEESILFLKRNPNSLSFWFVKNLFFFGDLEATVS